MGEHSGNVEWSGGANDGWGATVMIQARMAQGVIGRGTGPGDEARRRTNIKCHRREREGRKSGWNVSVPVSGLPFAEVRYISVVVKIIVRTG
jgi:hypothetical protein